MGPREGQRVVGQLDRQRLGQIAEPGQVVRVEVDDEAIRNERPVERDPALGLHRALDAPLQLEGLERRPEQPSRRAFEEAFKEPLDGGQGRHDRCRSLAEGPRRTRMKPPPT